MSGNSEKEMCDVARVEMSESLTPQVKKQQQAFVKLNVLFYLALLDCSLLTVSFFQNYTLNKWKMSWECHFLRCYFSTKEDDTTLNECQAPLDVNEAKCAEIAPETQPDEYIAAAGEEGKRFNLLF